MTLRKKILQATALLLLLSSCQSTYKIIVINDDVKSKDPIPKPTHLTHTIINFININKNSTENEMCGEAQWKKVSSAQGPVWSAIDVAATVGSQVASLAGVNTGPFGGGSPYSQVETDWYCSK